MKRYKPRVSVSDLSRRFPFLRFDPILGWRRQDCVWEIARTHHGDTEAPIACVQRIRAIEMRKKVTTARLLSTFATVRESTCRARRLAHAHLRLPCHAVLDEISAVVEGGVATRTTRSVAHGLTHDVLLDEMSRMHETFHPFREIKQRAPIE